MYSHPRRPQTSIETLNLYNTAYFIINYVLLHLFTVNVVAGRCRIVRPRLKTRGETTGRRHLRRWRSVEKAGAKRTIKVS